MGDIKLSGAGKAYLFGARLRLAAQEAGYTGREVASELADATGLNRITMGSYLRGERRASYEVCEVLGAHLGVSPKWLRKGRPDTVFEPPLRDTKAAPDIGELQEFKMQVMKLFSQYLPA